MAGQSLLGDLCTAVRLMQIRWFNIWNCYAASVEFGANVCLRLRGFSAEAGGPASHEAVRTPSHEKPISPPLSLPVGT
jgi:hypothetical protein